MVTQKYIFLFVVITMLIQCKKPVNQLDEDLEYKNKLSEKLYSVRNEDSLLMILQQFSEEKNDVGKMICYKHLGSLQRASARYPEAINNHNQGLRIALMMKDTIEIVQAMNNLGINYLRRGDLSEASQYHYQALNYAEAWSKLHTPIGTKNQNTSLNGIGNINLMLGHYDEAEKIFRNTLKDEIVMNNPIGQAINYDNLGLIFMKRQQYDSAYIYFQKSMEQNKIAKSDVRIGTCLIHIGELYEKQQKYDLAKREYLKAYELLDQTSNKWHWIQACLSLARINLTGGNIAEFNTYIQLVENTAKEIESSEHLAAAYLLKHDYSLRQGNYQLALEHFKQHIAMKDSVQGIQTSNQYMDIRLGHEHNKNMSQLQHMEAVNEVKQQKREYIILISWIIIIITLIIVILLYYAYRQRTRSNKTLKKLARVRSEFFTNITHEFRTPLTVIQGLNRQMQHNKDLTKKDIIAYREVIERQSNNLLNLVDQLLDIAKLKRGTEDSHWKRGNIVAYLHMSVETFSLYAREKGLKLLFYSEIPEIEMDFIPSYIDKIISNIISNAIKHTDEGGKIIFVVAKGNHANTIDIRISDTGEGIPEKDLERIFDFFYQCPEAKKRSGTGIGLAFTRLMIEKMKGKIEVESQLGRGSIFTINLPLKNKRISQISPLKKEEKPLVVFPEKEEDAIKDIPLEKEENNVQPLILIVEDNSDITLYIKLLLTDNYKVITALNGEEGLKAAEKYIPDLVITDVMMPVKDGYQFVMEMKENRLLNHIPVIMITAKSTDEDRIKGLRSGADAYIRKPFQRDELLLSIENIFENRRVLKEKYMSAITHSDMEGKLKNDTNLKFLQTITDIIYSEINNPELNASFLADKMAMSVSQLSRKINAITGYSTISYVLQLKLNKAKKMLVDGNLTMAEVSDACGFYDASYFSRVFKKEFGVSPSQYYDIPTQGK